MRLANYLEKFELLCGISKQIKNNFDISKKNIIFERHARYTRKHLGSCRTVKQNKTSPVLSRPELKSQLIRPNLLNKETKGTLFIQPGLMKSQIQNSLVCYKNSLLSPVTKCSFYWSCVKLHYLACKNMVLL